MNNFIILNVSFRLQSSYRGGLTEVSQFWEAATAFCYNHMKGINVLCWLNAENFKVKQAVHLATVLF